MPRRPPPPPPPCAAHPSPSPSPSDSATVARVASGSDAAARASTHRDTPSAGPPPAWTPADGADVLSLTEFVAPAVLHAARSGCLVFEPRGEDTDRGSTRGARASPRAVPPPRVPPPPLALARLAAPPALPVKKKAKKGGGGGGGAPPQPPRPGSGCLQPPTTPNPTRSICKFYMQGRCLRGAACEFTHAGVDPSTRLVPCRYAARGECMKGALCEFSHDATAQEPCARLLLTGACVLGGDCRFAHAEWGDADRAALFARAQRREAERAERGLKPTIGLMQADASAPVSPPPITPEAAAAAAHADVVAGAATVRAPLPPPPAAADLLAGALARRE